VIGFNIAEGWVRDVSEDVALELRVRCADQGLDPPEFLQGFLERRASIRSASWLGQFRR